MRQRAKVKGQLGNSAICEISLRSHRKRPIMGLDSLYGFGCADFGPGKDANPNRGFGG
jgi:hypothetical protein